MQTQPQSQPRSASPQGAQLDEDTQMQTQLDTGSATEEEGGGAAGGAGGDGWAVGDEGMLTPAEEAARARRLYEEGPWALAFCGSSAAAAAVHAR
jgi:hypothetical protein